MKCLRKVPLKALLSLLLVTTFADVRANSLLLDFGATATATLTDKTNSPAHALNILGTSDIAWNTASTLSSNSLVYADGSAASGVSYVLGRSNFGATNSEGVATNINFNNTTAINLALAGSSLTTGIYAGASPMKDGVFASGTSAVSTNALGLRIDGLPAGKYLVFAAVRNSNTQNSHNEQVFCTNGPVSSNYGFLNSPSSVQANLSTTYTLQDTYVAMSVTLNPGDSLFLACIGPTNSPVVERRGFLNLVEIITEPAIPQLTAQPSTSPLTLYAGESARFAATAIGAGPLSYFWRKDGVVLNDGNNIFGSQSNILTLTNLSAANFGTYDLVVSNLNGTATSNGKQLNIISPATEYEKAVLSNNTAVAYYRFNESADSTSGSLPARDFVGGFDGVYGKDTLNMFYGTAGPQPSDSLPGFESGNGAVQFNNYPLYTASAVSVPSWPINTNTVTLMAWINPTGPQTAFEGLIMGRGANVAGLNYSGSTNANGEYTLGYIWNNEANTYNWNSGLIPPQGMWSLVALVVTPTDATIYVGNRNGIASAVHTYPHVVQKFTGPITIGNDSFNLGTRSFNGNMDEVAVFGSALSKSQIIALLTVGSGIANFAPTIVTSPSSKSLYEQQTALFTVFAVGSDPLHYQWQIKNNGVFVNLADGGRISGVNTPTLAISNINAADATDYLVIVTNAMDSATSTAATLTVLPISPPINFTTITNLGDWDTAGYWTPDEPASLSAVKEPGSTYELMTGSVLRTPMTVLATFPGNLLTVHGTEALKAVIGLKSTTNYFKKIVLDGGAIANYRDATYNAVLVGEELRVQADARLSAAPANVAGRAIRIESKLTGNGSLSCQCVAGTAFLPSATGGINIAGANNTFSGTWDIVAGTLVGSTPNALGTNTITVESGGALQTTYDINNPKGDLILYGRMNLTQNDTFRRLYIGGTNGVIVNAGTYTYSQLALAYPTNFPSTWTGQTGVETLTNASGSITVLEGAPAPVPPGSLVFASVSGVPQLTWTNPATILLSATNILGPWVTNSGATSPYQITTTPTSQMFFRLQSQ